MSPGLFRLLLASLVFASHASRLAFGTTAVYVFFVLSGYWISRMWHAKYLRALHPYLTFMLSRFWRLLPVFLLITVITVLLRWGLGIRMPIDAHWLIANSLILGSASLHDATIYSANWSLDVEAQFYLLVPLFFVLMKYSRRAGWILLTLLSLGSLIFLLVEQRALFATLPPYAAFFAIGVAAAFRDWRPSRGIGLASAGATLAFTAIVIAMPATRELLIRSVESAQLPHDHAVEVILALLAAPYALSTVRRRSSPLDHMFGDLSYVVYLLHGTAAWLVFRYFGALPMAQRMPYLAAAIVLVYGGSYVIWRFYDHPINLWRERVIRRLAAHGFRGDVSPPDAAAQAAATPSD